MIWCYGHILRSLFFFFFQAEDGIRDDLVTGVQTCALPISDFYESIDIGAKGAVALVGTDGVIRARRTKGEQGIGVAVNGGPLMRHFARSGVGRAACRGRG